jgi:hypothetical protein
MTTAGELRRIWDRLELPAAEGAAEAARRPAKVVLRGATVRQFRLRYVKAPRPNRRR